MKRQLTLLLLALAPTAQAHMYLPIREATAGERTDVPLRVSHGCDGSPTIAVTTTIPPGVTNLSIEHRRDWTITLTMRPLDPPQRGEGGQMIRETVDTITWAGNSLPEGRFEAFTYRAVMPKAAGRIYFPTVQRCEKGEHRWVATPKPGQSHEQLMRAEKEPAPSLLLIAPKANAGHQH
jgi:periplasmic copper chaperone A